MPTDRLPAALRHSDDGAIRVGRTRVSLDSLAALFDEGMSPEQAVLSFPTLDLADVYEAFAFVLREPEAVRVYLASRASEADEQRAARGSSSGENLVARLRASRPRAAAAGS